MQKPVIFNQECGSHYIVLCTTNPIIYLFLDINHAYQMLSLSCVWIQIYNYLLKYGKSGFDRLGSLCN
jgi:hypothetical protein